MVARVISVVRVIRVAIRMLVTGIHARCSVTV